jgi:hypothetical protein
LTKSVFDCIILEISELKTIMSEAIFKNNEGLTNFDYRVFICNVCLIWSAIKSIPGQVYSAIFNRNNQPADGQNQNPIGNAIGNMFGFGDKSGTTPTKNSNAGSAGAQPNYDMIRQMANVNSNPSQQTGGNSSMAQTSQAIQQQQAQNRQADDYRKLRQQASGSKGSQM